MESASDQRIIDGLRKREDAAFHFLQVKYQDSIRLMVNEMGGSNEDAKDTFNEGVIALIRLVDQEDFRLTCRLGTLVYALCKKKWCQQLEKQAAARNYHVRRVEAESEEDFTEDMDRQLMEEIIWECFNKLGESCRELLSEYLKEVSPQEIARKTGRSYNYVRRKKSTCHSRLMELIERHPDYRLIRDEVKQRRKETSRITG